MKVHPNENILSEVHPKRLKKTEKSSDIEFGTILKERIENSAKGDADIQNSTFLGHVSDVRFNTVSPIEKTTIIDRVEKYLDILDEYHQKLGNPQATLKDMYPFIQEMEERKKTLLPVLDSLQDGDRLKDILNQALITSSLEIIKFNRGDYLNA